MSDDDMIRRGDIGPAICKAGLHNLDKAIAALPARGVGVKPLVWEAREDIAGLHNAQSAIGWWYNVHELADGRYKYDGDPAIGLNATPKAFPTLDAAKAAAQADYEARVLTALIPQSGTDALRQARVEGMRVCEQLARDNDCILDGEEIADAIAALIAREGGE